MKIELLNLKDVDYNLQLEVRNWRNCEHVAKYFQIPYLEEAIHKNWLKSLHEENPKNIAFIIKVNNEFVGLSYFLRVNFLLKETEWGIYIYKENLRGLGIGQKIIELNINYARNVLNFKVIRLEVLKNNKNAIRLYKKNGFKFEKEKDDQVLCYKLNL